MVRNDHVLGSISLPPSHRARISRAEAARCIGLDLTNRKLDPVGTVLHGLPVAIVPRGAPHNMLLEQNKQPVYRSKVPLRCFHPFDRVQERTQYGQERIIVEECEVE